MTGPDGTAGGDLEGGIPEQGRPDFDPWLDLPRADDVPEDHPVREMLSAVADDPAAPPSSVTVAAILAAARAAAPAGTAPNADADADPDEISRVIDIDPETGRPRYVPPAYSRAQAPGAAPAGDAVPTPVWSGTATPAPVVPASVLQARRLRQRRRLTAVLAAACVIGVAVVAVPFAVSRNGDSMASSATAATTAAAGAASSAAGGSAAAGRASSEAGGATTTLGQPGSAGAGESLGDTGNLAAPSQLSAAGSAAGSAAPAPGAVPNGAAEATPSTGAPAAGTGSGACAELPPAVATALAGALPGGLYGDQQPLTTGCGADGVFGATIPNAQGQAPLTVTVNRVAEGACVTAAGPDLGCVSIGAGQYVSTTADGGLVVYAYAGGLEVAIAQGLGNTDGSADPSAGSATVEELLQAAQAAADAAAAG